MKMLLALLAVAGLSGCAVYPAPAYETYGGVVVGQPYAVAPPMPIYSGVYRYNGSPVYAHPRIHNRVHSGARDRDRDGVPNRVDRDRDGDGVRNRQDRRPNNPGRR